MVRARTSSWQPLSSQRRSRCTYLLQTQALITSAAQASYACIPIHSGQALQGRGDSAGKPQCRTQESAAHRRWPIPLVSSTTRLPSDSTVCPAMHSDL